MYARFCMEVFYVLYINFHSYVHSLLIIFNALVLTLSKSQSTFDYSVQTIRTNVYLQLYELQVTYSYMRTFFSEDTMQAKLYFKIYRNRPDTSGWLLD